MNERLDHLHTDIDFYMDWSGALFEQEKCSLASLIPDLEDTLNVLDFSAILDHETTKKGGNHEAC